MYTRNSQSFKESCGTRNWMISRRSEYATSLLRVQLCKIKQAWLQGLLLWEQVGLYAFFMPLLCIAAKMRFGHCAFGSWAWILIEGKNEYHVDRERGEEISITPFPPKASFLLTLRSPSPFPPEENEWGGRRIINNFTIPVSNFKVRWKEGSGYDEGSRGGLLGRAI